MLEVRRGAFLEGRHGDPNRNTMAEAGDGDDRRRVVDVICRVMAVQVTGKPLSFLAIEMGVPMLGRLD